MANQNDKLPKVHIINPMWNPNAGSENRALETARLLSPFADTQIWSEHKPANDDFFKREGVRLIRPRLLRFPRKGVFIFIGTYFYVGNWLRYARPKRIIVLFNVTQISSLGLFIKNLKDKNVKCPIDLAYTAEWMIESVGLPGRYIQSPIDLSRFKPSIITKDVDHHPYVIGRLSRDIEYKHHPDDPSLYRSLALSGFRVRIMGGTVLAKHLENVQGVELLPPGAEPSELFLKSLDCFVYRTAPDYFEPSGRVVAEAMASGLPVICGRNGGYFEIIEHGVNGFFFDNNQEAIEIIMKLKSSLAITKQLSKAARTAMEDLYSQESTNKIIEYLISEVPFSDISKYLNSEFIESLSSAQTSYPENKVELS
jgi:glycosyltransferase involved in cell wall biosynthesis